MAELEIDVRITPGLLRWLVLGFLLCGWAAELSTESFTMSTTYPAPTAVYTRIITTGDTYLARDPGGKVGIGTTNPQAMLDVNGAAKIGGDFTAAGKISAADVQVNNQSVITSIQCQSGCHAARDPLKNNTFILTVP